MPAFHACTQAPNDGTLLKGKEEEYLICAREERAKPIGDRRGGRWSPAERGRGGSGARPQAARLFRWTGAESVGIGGRSCGAFNDRAVGGEGAVCQWHTVGAGRTGPGSEGLVGGRSSGNHAPRRAFVRSNDFPQTGAVNISLATDEITVSGFPFPDRSDERKWSGGKDSTGAQRGAAKKAARLFP